MDMPVQCATLLQVVESCTPVQVFTGRAAMRPTQCELNIPKVPGTMTRDRAALMNPGKVWLQHGILQIMQWTRNMDRELLIGRCHTLLTAGLVTRVQVSSGMRTLFNTAFWLWDVALTLQLYLRASAGITISLDIAAVSTSAVHMPVIGGLGI